MHLAAHRLHFLRLSVNVTVHCHTDVGMPGDLLQGFDIAALACCVGEVTVSEYMCRRAVEAEGAQEAGELYHWR